MTKFELAKALLSQVKDESFSCSIYSSDGFDGWNSDEYIDLSAPQLRYLIKSKVGGEDALFEGLELEEADADSMISDLSRELSWPDGYPSPHVNSVIPNELLGLEDKLDNIDGLSPEEISDLYESLISITSGEYTFEYTIGSEGMYFTEGAELKVFLEKDQILGLLNSQYDLSDILDTDFIDIDEEYLNDIANDADLAENYDYLSYGGSSDDFEAYIHSWVYMIDRILKDDIAEENALRFIDFIAEGDYERDFDDWLLDN